MIDDESALCRCGHPWQAHQHYRTGDDCGICGRAGCPRFRRLRPTVRWQAMLRALARAARDGRR